ncbi:Spy/CpxP family protein refolding chaperone [Planctobacterium marinum]
MKKQLLVISLIAASVVTGGFVTAHERDKEHNPRKQMMQIFKQLDLEREQKQAIRSVMHDAKDQMQVYREDMKKLHQEMMALVTSGNSSEASVATVLSQYEETLAAMTLTKSNNKYAVYQVLTEPQREKARTLMEEQRLRMESRDSGERFARMAEKLELSDNQVAQIEPLLEEVKESRMALRDLMHGFKEAQRQWFEDGSYSEEKVNELFATTFPEFQQKLYAVVASHQQIYLQLTEEQQQQVQSTAGKRFMPRML